MITQLMSFVFGGGSTSVKEVAEVFRENAEAAAVREATGKAASLAQFAAEFQHQRRGMFDRLVDALNRLPRPLLALGTIGLFVSAMAEPDWFASRMTGIALIPEPLWWLMGAIVSFYFGARHQVKGQEFQRSVVQTLAMQQAKSAPLAAAPETPDAPADVEPQIGAPLQVALAHKGISSGEPNAALDDWRASHAV